MRNLLLISALLASTSLSAKISNDFFTASQKEAVINEIDNVCGDTWCEGDYNFKFNELACEKLTHTCELTFQFIALDDNEVEKFSPIQVCRVENIKGFRDLMDNKHSLNENFYEAISDCISEKEGNIQF